MRRLILILTLSIPVSACSSGSQEPAPAPAPPAPSPTPPPTFAQVQAIIQANCAKCHDGKTQPILDTTEAQLKATPAKALLESRQMPPPPNVISDADRASLLAFLQ